MPRFPPRGPHGRLFPRFDGTIKALRLPAVLPAKLRFLRPAGTTVAPGSFRFSHRHPAQNDGPGVGHPVSPSGSFSVETTGSPKFLGNPPFPFAHVLRPRPAETSLTTCGTFAWPPLRERRRRRRQRLSRLNSMAFGIAAYVSRCWLPVTAQDWLPGAGQALLGGLPPAGFRQKVFNSLHVRCPPLPSFLAQSPFLFFLRFPVHGSCMLSFDSGGDSRDLNLRPTSFAAQARSCIVGIS